MCGVKVTDILRVLSWKRDRKRWHNYTDCKYKLCLLVHKSLLGHTLDYILDLLTPVVEIPARSALRALSCGDLVVAGTRRRIDDMLVCCWTAIIDQVDDRPEAATINKLISAPTENIFWVCLPAPKNRLICFVKPVQSI